MILAITFFASPAVGKLSRAAARQAAAATTVPSAASALELGTVFKRPLRAADE